jgi:hypothetical protein
VLDVTSGGGLVPSHSRRAYVVGAVKIPHEQRDVAHAVLTPADDRGFFNVIGADDDPAAGHTQPVGANVTYRVELTDAEAERFRAASNCRYVELDGVDHEQIGAVSTPAASSMRFMRADFPRTDVYHGRDVLVGLLDGGTTAAVRSYLGATMVSRKIFSANQPGADEITSDHGCLVAPCLIPVGGRFLDGIVTEDNGSITRSNAAAGAVWCADQGAKVVNYSAGGTTPDSVWTDALDYLQPLGVHFFASMGNDGLNQAYYPAAYSTTYANVHSSIAWDETTNTRRSTSNYTATASGVAPGANVLGLTPTATPMVWSGTSASAPHMAQLCAMGMTGGRFTAAQVGAALKATTGNTGQPTAEQGGGRYDLQAALTSLGGFTNLPAAAFRRNLSPNPSVEVNLTGYGLAATRAGLTASGALSSTITTPFGITYLSIGVTGDGSTSATTADVEVGLGNVAVTAGQPYTFSTHSRIATAGPTLQWWLRWENAAGTSLGEVAGDKSPVLSTVWARYHLTATAPASATRAVMRVRGWGFTATSLVSWRLDGFHYEQTSGLKPYFDGSTGGAVWDGTVNNSTSRVGATAPTGNTGSPYTAVFRDNTPYPVIPLATTDVAVSGQAALTSAISAWTPGQRLVLAAGSYTDLTVTGKAGTAASPLSIVAASDGGPVFSGKGNIKDTSYITIRGLSFPTDPVGDLFQFRGTSHHFKLHRCTFGPAAHPGSATSGEAGTYVFVGDDCHNFRISYNELRNKSRAGNGVRVYGNFTTQTMAKYGVIDHNIVRDFYPAVVNDFEPFRIGVSSMSLTDSFVHVERNYVGGIKSEPEVISIKSGKCRVFGNTIEKSAGGPVIRHGVATIMTDNYVIDGAGTVNTNSEGSGGPRFYDADHEVAYNLLQGLSGTSYQAALQLDGGESGTSLSRHAAIVRANVHHNIVVECATPITVNAHYSIKPANSKVEDNLVAASGSAAVQYLNGATAATTGSVQRNDWHATAAAAGLVKDAKGAFGKAGFGPRVTMLRRSDVGPAGDLAETDGLGNGTGTGGGGGGGTPPPDPTVFAVDAGADAQVLPGATFTRTALETGAGTVATRKWEVLSEPAGTPAAPTTGGTGGPLTDRTSVSYTNTAGTTSVGHIYAAGLDWSKPVGLLLYTDGSGEFGLANTSSSYLLAGGNGLIAKAKKHNMILVTPRAPGGPCDDGDGVDEHHHQADLGERLRRDPGAGEVQHRPDAGVHRRLLKRQPVHDGVLRASVRLGVDGRRAAAGDHLRRLPEGHRELSGRVQDGGGGGVGCRVR